jgi:hypothetical protein
VSAAAAPAAFSDPVLEYFAAHAIDPIIARAAGVTGGNGCIAYPYADADGSFERTRQLNGGHAKTGRPLCCWWPVGPPRRAGTVLICEGEPDALAALTAIRGVRDPIAAEILAGVAVVAIPGASFPAHRLAAELRRVSASLAIIAADADQAGDQLAERSAGALRSTGIPTARLSLSSGDLADALVGAENGPNWLANAIADIEVEQPVARTETSPAAGRVITAQRFADIRAERTRWLWEGRIPLRAPTLLVGREKLGKSTLTVALAAGVSRGTLDGDLKGNPSSVLLLSYEDSAASTVKPRLLAAGADPARVFQAAALREGMRDLVSLPDDVDAIAAIVREHECRLVVVDPFSASLGAEINSHRDQDIRRAIAALAQLAELENAALLLVAHFNKAASGDSLTRVLGSRGLTAAARSVLAFGKAPDAEDGSPDRVLAHAACNLAAEAPSLACRIEPRVLDDESGTIETSRLAILGACDTRADDLLATRGEDERSDRDSAADWLADELANGEWQPSADIKARAKTEGISTRTLQRALAHLGVEYCREGVPPRSKWCLPTAPGTVGATGAVGTGANGQTRIAEPNTPPSEGQSRQSQGNGAIADPDAELARLAAKFEDEHCACMDAVADEAGDCAKCGRGFA